MSQYDDLLAAAEQKYGLPSGILQGQAAVESGGDPNAVSGKGAVGLMQFTPATAKAYGVDPTDPASSIDGAARFMADNLKATKGDVPEALRLYQGGPNRAGWGKENAAYAGKVLTAMPGDSGDLAAMGLAPASNATGTSVDDHADLSASGLSVPDDKALAASKAELDALVAPAASAATGTMVRDPKTGKEVPAIDPTTKGAFFGWGETESGQRYPMYGPPGAEPGKPSDSMLTNLGAGGKQGVEDVVASLDPAAAWIEKNIPGVVAAGEALGLPSVAETQQQHMQDRTVFNDTSGKSIAGTIGRLGGNVAATVPAIAAGGGVLGAGARALGAAPVADFLGGAAGSNLLTRGASLAANGALQGTAGAALTSSASDAPLLNQLETGAGIGTVLGPAGGVLGAGANALRQAVSPSVSPEVAALAQKAVGMGIPIRGSQISGSPAVRQLDSVLARIPGSGIAADNALQRASVTRAVGNTFGADADNLTPQVMTAAKSKISNVYNDVAGRNRLPLGPQAGGTFMQDAQGLVQAANLGPQNAGRVQNLLGEIEAKIGPSGHMSGKDFKALTSKGSMLDKASSSPDSEYAGVAKDLKNGLNQELAAVASPEDQAALSQANWQWKNMRTVDKLIANSPDNQINPALLQRPVSASFKNRAYTGAGDLGDIADISQRFLKDQGSSNTAERGAALNTIMNIAKYGAGGAAIAAGTHLGGIGLPEIGSALATGAGALTVGKVAGAALRSPAYRNRLISAALNANSSAPSVLSGYYLPTAAVTANRLIQGSAVSPKR